METALLFRHGTATLELIRDFGANNLLTPLGTTTYCI